MATGFDEIKSLVRSVEERLRAIERMEAGCQPVMVTRIDAVVKQLSDHEIRLTTKNQQINKLEKQMEQIVGMYRNISRLAWTIGVALILASGSFIWSLITHKIMVVFG